MIPEHIVEQLHGPVVLGLGTRDAGCRPRHAMPLGAVVAPDRVHVTFLLPTAVAAGVLADLADNGQVALGCGHPVTHKAYQFKGRYCDHHTANESEETVIRIWRDKVNACLTQAGYPAAIARTFVCGFTSTPATAVTFVPTKIFEQTPGPEAGRLVYQAEEP
jgi:hypothetical protein